VGSYFGYSVAVGDMNGDRLADVVVGAPWYTHLQGSQDYEVGLVTLYTQTPQHNFQLKVKLTGVRSRSHFGLSVACLGDINRDGYDDLAVGAPRDGPSGRGGVYIFLGSPKGLDKKPSQVLLSESLAQDSVNTFGWSLVAGEDLDGNEYPDLVVGAHDTNSAFVFRTRPVV
ncbi:integrin alpha-PS2-like, partial [Homarus americanus]|uniref:integrin alpha-PS2-like n=1 Tax=Homarus americanus TaxID=6706 RepID=UPI001C436A17